MNVTQTTQQAMQEVLQRDAAQRAGQGGCAQLIKQEVIHDGTPGSGTCKYAARFTYSNGKVETLWGV